MNPLIGFACFFLTVNALISFPTNGSDIMMEMIVPESFSYSETKGVFVAGSAQWGSVYSVYPNGTTSMLANITQPGLGCSGAFIDSKRNIFWTNMINFTAVSGYYWYGAPLDGSWPNFLFGFDLTNGTLVHNISLQQTGNAYANDVAMDPAGNLYVSDSSESKIWKIDTTFKVSVLANFSGEVQTGVPELNGLRVANGSLFIWTYSNLNRLYKVNLTSGSYVRVPVGGYNISTSDGFEFSSNGDMIVAGTPSSILVRSSDNWATANVIATFTPIVPDPAYSGQAVAIVNGVPNVLLINWYTTDPNLIEPAVWTYLSTNSTVSAMSSSSMGSNSRSSSSLASTTSQDTSDASILSSIFLLSSIFVATL